MFSSQWTWPRGRKTQESGADGCRPSPAHMPTPPARMHRTSSYSWKWSGARPGGIAAHELRDLPAAHRCRPSGRGTSGRRSSAAARAPRAHGRPARAVARGRRRGGSGRVRRPGSGQRALTSVSGPGPGHRGSGTRRAARTRPVSGPISCGLAVDVRGAPSLEDEQDLVAGARCASAGDSPPGSSSRTRSEIAAAPLSRPM